MKLRWILPPIAVSCLGAAIWITLHGSRVSPSSLLASAQERLARRPSDPGGALREIDEALHLAGTSEPPELRISLLEMRARLYQAQGLPDLALADCRARLSEFGPEAKTLQLANQLCLQLGDSGAALEFATRLEALDPARAKSLLGRCRVALADAPLARIERMARVALPRDSADIAIHLAQRAAVFAAQPGTSTAALDELLDLFSSTEDRRLMSELVSEAAEHLEAARTAFVQSLEPGTTVNAVAGLQDLLIRGGADLEVAELGMVALSLPKLAQPLPVLARTASTLVRLGRDERARALVLGLRERGPEVLDPRSLPSNELRDELEEWCFLLEDLGLWPELRVAARELQERAKLRRDDEKGQLSEFMLGLADLREGKLASAQNSFDKVSAQPPRMRDVPIRTWLGLAEVAALQKQAAQHRYALLLATKDAPLDPEEPLRAQLGDAWLQLAQMLRAEGETLQAEIAFTHGLRCSVRRAEELEARWHEEGRKTLGRRGASGPYALYTRAQNELDRGLYSEALEDVQTLLEQFPGLGPALEIASKAAFRMRNYALAVEISLELLERGWSSRESSARLRAVPPEYFLPVDRVRWMHLDPYGSLDGVLARLTELGNTEGAALAALAGPTKWQPPEVIARSGSALSNVGNVAAAHDVFAQLPADSEAFRSVAGLALRVAAERARTVDDGALADTVTRLQESGKAEDPQLVAALDTLLVSGRTAEAEAVLAWLAPQSTPFLGEALLRSSTLSAMRRTGAAIDQDLERAAALLEPGRPEIGRLLAASDRSDWSEVEREARFLLDTAWAQEPARHLVLLLLASELESAVQDVIGTRFDGRDPLHDFGAAWLALLARDRLVDDDAGAPDLPELPAPLAEHLDARTALLTALACESAPWAAWSLARIAEWPEALRVEPWTLVLTALAHDSLGDARGARDTLEPLLLAKSDSAEVWALAARLEAELHGKSAALPLEFGWLAAAGLESSEDPALAVLQAQALLAGGKPEEAVRRLEQALEHAPHDTALLAELARIENAPGRRARAIQRYGTLFAKLPAEERAPYVLPLLETLRAARDAEEIGEERWWTEVEALEAELPDDPALPRELAERAFERPQQGPQIARTLALERLDRFRERTLRRPVELLRAGEARRWTRLLARFTPERAVRFARAELEADPNNPEVWRAEAEALLAAEHWEEALDALDAVLAIAPERDTARLSALTGFQVRDDPADYLARLKAIERIDATASGDPALAFYRAIATLRADKPQKEALETAAADGLALWEQRETNGLSGSRNGRAFACALYFAGKIESALQVLMQSLRADSPPLEFDEIKALAYLMRAGPAKRRQAADAATAGGDAPGETPPAGAAPAPAGVDGAAAPAPRAPGPGPKAALRKQQALEKQGKNKKE